MGEEEEEEPPYNFELSPALAGVWTLLSLVLFVAAAVGVGLLYALPGHSPFTTASSLLLWPVAFLVVLPLHELLHAALVPVFGGRPRFGAGIKSGMPYLYVTDPGRRFSRDQFLAIAIAPLAVIDLTALAILLLQPGWSWAGPALVANTSGAIGDLWVVGLLLRFPRWTLVEDRTLGFAVWAGRGHSEMEVRALAPRHRVLAPTWLATWVLVTLAVLAVLPIPLLVLAGRADPQAADSAIGWGPFVLAALHRRAGGHPGTRTVAAEVNLLLLFLLAALLAGALLYAWRRWRRM